MNSDVPFRKVAVLGELEDGSLWISSNINAGETLILMEYAKKRVIFGE